MMNEDEVDSALEWFKLYLTHVIDDSHGRTIKLHDVFGGPLGFFFLCEWEDTHVFFCQDAYLTVSSIDGGTRQ